MNLNGQWAFRFDPDDEGTDASWQQDDASAYDREITVPFSWASPLSGIGDNTKGIGWYRRTADWQPEQPDARIFLRFGAVDYACEAWVNGVSVGTHRGGYGAFEFEVTAQWRPAGGNSIVVRAQDEDHDYQARGKQGYGEIRGIWQPVWLEARPQTYVHDARFSAALDGRVAVKVRIAAHAPGEAKLALRFGDGVAHEAGLALEAGMNEAEVSFAVNEPKLWSPETPHLYEGELELSGAFGSDIVETYFGIREIGAARFGERGYRWITLNGKPVYLNGTLDQSYHQTGYFTYPTDEEMRGEIHLMKRLGLNFVRIHIKPDDPRKLYWADKLGILVMEDMPCFWGNPDERARSSYESEAREIIERDWNHPSIICWVMFNETWGLRTDRQASGMTGGAPGEESGYLPETQEWVKDMYRLAKRLDPTRMVEDNSPCNWDHVETDINTWHFYINGYEQVRAHIEEVVSHTFPGSTFNYIGGHVQTAAPLMNSECGNVWGIEGGAGDSDLAWHYRYMLNEFRKHDKLCGFIFTEFRDVTNEFNGYYRLDGTDKDFGYGYFVPGMTIADLHAPDFVAIDGPPCRTVDAGAVVTVPLIASSFSDRYHGETLRLSWELWHEQLGTRIVSAAGSFAAAWSGYGSTPLESVTVALPNRDAVAVLAVTLTDADGRAVTRNFTTFDVRAAAETLESDPNGAALSVPVTAFAAQSFGRHWTSVAGCKLNGAEQGSFVYDVALPDKDALPYIGSLEICFEASAKRVLARDVEGSRLQHGVDMMHGAAAQVEYNPNTYYMTDEQRHPSRVDVLVDGERIGSFALPDDPADCRGVLSWHYQPAANRLDDAGSYGYWCQAAAPGRIAAKLDGSRSFRLELQADSGGLALYGRNAGRYPIDLLIRYR